jgi:hypothetical protein
MTEEQSWVDQLRKSKGLVATVCTTGTVLPEYAHNFMELRSFNETNDFRGIEYVTFNAVFVEAGRDAACEHAVNQGYDWLLQIDADAAPFKADSLIKLLETAYVTHPYLNAVGAYSQLKGDVPIPTIDTGTGRWEEHYPNTGVLPVIRTGAHFLLVKVPTLQTMGKPWFRSRRVLPPLDAFREVDNFARCELDGRNPFSSTMDWVALVASASAAAVKDGNAEQSVGEDSGFCDKLKAIGGNIAVDTRVVAGHMDRKYIVPDDLRSAMDERELPARQLCGVLE